MTSVAGLTTLPPTGWSWYGNASKLCADIFLMCISQHFKHVNIVPFNKRRLKDKIINYNLVFSLICIDVGFFMRKPSDVISRIFCGCTGLHFNRSLWRFVALIFFNIYLFRDKHKMPTSPKMHLTHFVMASQVTDPYQMLDIAPLLTLA